MYQITFSSKAKKQFLKLEKNIQVRIIAALKRIRIRPETYLVRLVDDPGYKLRVGDYKVIVDVVKDKLLVLVVKVGHRKKVYK